MQLAENSRWKTKAARLGAVHILVSNLVLKTLTTINSGRINFPRESMRFEGKNLIKLRQLHLSERKGRDFFFFKRQQ